jgi:cathepsin B
MKLFVLTTVLALTAIAFGLYKYNQVHNKTFADELADIANKVNSMNTTWKATRHAKWEGVDRDTITQFMMKNEVFNLKSSNNIKVHASHIVGSAPATFDSRQQWPNCESIREIRDQSACGSCWAFGAAETMSDRICIASGQQDQTRVSAEDLLECCAECGFGCEGGFPPSAMQFWKDHGVVSGGLYNDRSTCKPYKFEPCAHHVAPGKYPACMNGEYDTPNCNQSCSDGNTALDYLTDKRKASEAYTVRGEAQMMAEISTKGPVEGSFTVYGDFPTYQSGVYQHVTGSVLGGHAIKILGYGEENGTNYWLVANSWNETWGDHGFFKILRGSNHCGIEGSAEAGTPIV